jgi:hypothetical protein
MRDLRSEAAAQFPYLIANDVRDHKAWAKRIMHREERGDTLLTHYQVKEARMALGQEKKPDEQKG